MNLSPPAPSRPLRLFSIAAAWLWRLLVALAMLTVLAWALLHGWIVPRIADYRPALEARASAAVGAEVRIGTIEAHSNGLIPSFELHDVRLLDAQGRDALRLGRVVAAVSPRSLWGLRFEQLYIDQPELDIRRSKEGRITVAGLDVSGPQDGGGSAADWFFSQSEFVIQGGTLRWTDEQRGAPPLALTGVNFIARNSARRHALRLAATPPPAWGEPFVLTGVFRQPLLSPLLEARRGHWQDWTGQLYADFARVDISALRRYVDVGADLAQGRGALRAWADVSRASITAATADLALLGLQVRLRPDLASLDLRNITGRLSGSPLPGGLDFSTQALQFDTDDGLHWPGGNVALRYSQPTAAANSAASSAQTKLPDGSGRGELRADRLDLQALAHIAGRLPLDKAAHALLQSHAPKGLVETLVASWEGPLGSPQKYAVKGRISDLSVQAQTTATASLARPTASATATTESPGVRGLSIDFSASQKGGQASLRIKNGSLDLPGAFTEPELLLDELSAQTQWQIDGDKWAVDVTQLKFKNADTQGDGQVRWRTADAATSSSGSRFPGVVDAQLQLARGDAKRVARYLPNLVSQTARDYVAAAVLAGDVSAVKVRLKGDLNDMPARPGKSAEFRIAAHLDNTVYAFVPPTGSGLQWPALTQMSGDIVFSGNQMQLKVSKALLAGAPGTPISRIEAEIADLSKPTLVEVKAQGRGPLPEMSRLLLQTPLQPKLSAALGRAALAGAADYKLQLTLPINTIDKTRVAGTVLLAGNDAQMRPETPAFSQLRGSVLFSENGFALANLQGRTLGGEARLEGGSRALLGNAAMTGLLPVGATSTASAAGNPAAEPSMAFRIQGTATAEGLRQASELGLVSQLARSASGSAAYSVWLGFRQGLPEFSVVSNLQGMTLTLPAPLGKAAEAALPMRYDNLLVRESLLPDAAGQQHPRDQLLLELGKQINVQYERDISAEQPRVLRGQIAVGLASGESAAPMNDEVVANVNLPRLDADAWAVLLAGPAVVKSLSTLPLPNTPPAQVLPAASTINVVANTAYLPTRLAIRAKEFSWEGRKLGNLVVGGSRVGSTWRANLDANELSGYLEYRQAQSGAASSGSNQALLYARLARLSIAPSAASDVEALLDEQPANIPALDITVQDFELRGKKLGRIEIEAVNLGGFAGPGTSSNPGRMREWRLNKFNLILPEATLTAKGNWAARSNAGEAAFAASAANDSRRRTAMNFTLDIADSGQLLTRLGVKDVVRGGAGKLQGTVGWLGSPLSLDYPSMSGQFNVNINKGQFLQADPGLAKLLGVLNLQTLVRRLTLDFTDVFSAGFAFDFVRGDVNIERGQASTNNLQMKGVSAAVLMEGSADIARETQDIKAVVVPELNAGTASLITTIINPAVGIGSFLAQLFFREPLIRANTQEFHISGSWADPKVTKVERQASVSPALTPPLPTPTPAPAQ